MTTGTKEHMGQTLDAMGDGFRAGLDATVKAQETWFDTMNEMFKNPANFGGFVPNTGQFANEWMPLMAENTRVMTDCFSANVREGLGVAKTVCQTGAMTGSMTGSMTDNADSYQTARQVFDATFDALRTNFDAFGKASKSTMDNCSNFFKSSCCEPAMSKPAPKSSK